MTCFASFSALRSISSVKPKNYAASTLAVIGSSHEPLLFLTADYRVIVASISFCQAFDVDPRTASGMKLSELANGAWAMPQLASLLRATAAGSVQIESYEIDLKRPGHSNRQLLVNARTLDDGAGPGDHVQLLVAITDITDARAEARHTDDLLREKAILLQEVQHRVANSLQIIARVLMQSAGRVQSEEARGIIRDAHHRVMSIAELQRHLSKATEDKSFSGTISSNSATASAPP
jgi:hypothetical protein